jgi:hypothetical protein
MVARPELEQVIIALTEKEVITDEQAKQARVATHARTKDGFTMDVLRWRQRALRSQDSRWRRRKRNAF